MPLLFARERLSILVGLGLLSACSGALTGEPGVDSGTSVDGGVTTDTAATGDAVAPNPDGGTMDGSLPVDMSGIPDFGTPIDAGPVVDSCSAGANTYYFSSVSGDDTRSNAEARDPSTPWRTLEKANSVAASLPPGGCILLRRGEVFQGSLTLTASGSAGNAITIGSYGDGARPIVSGFTNVDAWDAPVGNIYTSTNEISTLAEVNMVLIGSANTPMGRLPKTGYWTMSSGTHDSLTDPTNITSNWDGAEVVVRPARWILDRFRVASTSEGTLSFSSDSAYTPSAGWGYFIQNDLRTLTAPGDWYYNPTTHRLSMYGTSTPTGVQASSLETGATVDGASYVTFDNIGFRGFTNAGINTHTAGTHITIQNCDFTYLGHDGIYAYPNTGFLAVTGSTFAEINSTAILAGSSDDAVIRGNTLYNIGNIPGAGSSGDGGYEGIVSNGERGEISFNAIRRVGYVGIKWDGDGTVVANNFVDTTNYIKDDGGGIYTYPSQGQSSYLHQRTVRDNIVINSLGAGPGSTAADRPEGHGIYDDGTAANVDYLRNTIAHAHIGLFINGGHEINATSNTIYDTWRGIYLIKYDATEITNISLQSNISVARTADQYTAYIEPDAEMMPATFSADNNTWARPIDDDKVIWRGYMLTNILHSVAEWQAFSGQDAHAQRSPITVASPDDIRFEYNETSTDRVVALDRSYVDMTGAPQSGTITLTPFTSVVLLASP